MSHFYLYPLLHSQGYSSFQIQQILHSFGLFNNFPYQGVQFHELPSYGQNFVSRTSFSRNLIIQQTTPSDIEAKTGNQTEGMNSNRNHFILRQDLVKQEQAESQQKTSQRQLHQKEQSGNHKNRKYRKKKQIKKMSLKQKRQKQLKRNQTQNSKRNIIPNQIHQMLSILFKKKKSTHLVEQLIKKYSLTSLKNSLSVQRFYLYQCILKERISHYANQQSLKMLMEPLQPACRIYSKEQQEIYCKIGLTLINYFLNNEATLVILNSKRIKSENKLDHLKSKRYLAYVLKEMVELKNQK